MELQNENNIVSVKGNIASVSDFDLIKQKVEEVKSKHHNIILKIYDSLVINSSLIGYLVKVVNQDGITINMQVGNEILFELLDDLGLITTFNLQKL